MITFEVNDMTCGHCVSAITKAVTDADPNARVEIDLATHRVQVEPGSADQSRLARAIEDAGYSPVQVTVSPPAAAPVAAKSAGGCCGGCR